MATDANSKRYSTVTSQVPAEAVPTGVAAHVYNSTQTLHWEGSVALIDQEALEVQYLGGTLNISGGRSEWTTMQAVVQQVSVSAAGGTTSITFGPPNHLSIQDIIELMRVGRDQTIYQMGSPDDEEDNGDSVLEAGYAYPGTNTTEAAPILIRPSFHTELLGTGKVLIWPGRFSVRKLDGGVEDKATKVGGVDLADKPLALSGTGDLGVEIETDQYGNITAGPEVKFASGSPQSHRPPETLGESDPCQTGLYRWKLADVGSTDISNRRSGAIVYEIDTSLKNAGGTAKIFKGRNNTENELRGITGSTPEGYLPEDPVPGSGITRKPCAVTVTQNDTDILIEATVDLEDGTDGEISTGGNDIHVEHTAGGGIITLANKNKAVFQPAEGDVGYYEYYCAVAGEVGHVFLYGTEPTVLEESGGGDHTFTHDPEDWVSDTGDAGVFPSSE